jgi:dihydroxyacetone kinase-like predicted kinase
MIPPNFHLEFILNTYNASQEQIRSSLVEFAEALEISQVPLEDSTKDKNFKVRIHTADPTVIFDICAQFGRIKSVKINENGFPDG